MLALLFLLAIGQPLPQPTEPSPTPQNCSEVLRSLEVYRDHDRLVIWAAIRDLDDAIAAIADGDIEAFSRSYVASAIRSSAVLDGEARRQLDAVLVPLEDTHSIVDLAFVGPGPLDEALLFRIASRYKGMRVAIAPIVPNIIYSQDDAIAFLLREARGRRDQLTVGKR